LIGAKRLVALGRFAEDRALSVNETVPLEIIRIPHPSPANPQANKGWAEQVDKLLKRTCPRDPVLVTAQG